MNELQLCTITTAYSTGEEIVFNKQYGSFYPLKMARKEDIYERNPAVVAQEIKKLIENKPLLFPILVIENFREALKGRANAIDSKLEITFSFWGIINFLRHFFSSSYKTNLENEKVALQELEQAIQSAPLPPVLTPGKKYNDYGWKPQPSSSSPKKVDSQSPSREDLDLFKTPAPRKKSPGVNEASQPDPDDFKNIFYVGDGLIPKKLTIKALKEMKESEATRITEEQLPNDLTKEEIASLPPSVALRIHMLKIAKSMQQTPTTGDSDVLSPI